MEVVLRAVLDTDDPGIQRLMDDPDVKQWNAMKGETAAQWRAIREQDGVDVRTWAIAATADDRFLGTLSVMDIDHTHGTCEVGYRVLATERGRGVGTAALRLVCEQVFTELGLRRVQLFHALDNPGSCRVAERAGFSLEGTLRQSYVYGDGLAYDEHLHARLPQADPPC